MSLRLGSDLECGTTLKIHNATGQDFKFRKVPGDLVDILESFSGELASTIPYLADHDAADWPGEDAGLMRRATNSRRRAGGLLGVISWILPSQMPLYRKPKI